MSEILDPDSSEYRVLVLSGRMAALDEIAGEIARMADRLENASENDDPYDLLMENWRELLDWLNDAVVEAMAESELLRSESGLSG